MGAEFQSKKYVPNSGYTMSTGIFLDETEAYYVQVIDNGSDTFTVDLVNEEKDIEIRIAGQPLWNGTGVNESLTVSSQEPELPETDDELEAYARYALEHGDDFAYDGPDVVEYLDDELL